MSKSVRMQLIGIRLCEAVRDACSFAYANSGEPVPQGKERVLHALKREEAEAFKYACGGRVNSSGQWELDEGATRALGKCVGALQSALDAAYDETLDARSFITLATLWVEDVRSGNPEAGIKPMPKRPVDRWLTWRRMAELLSELRGMYPDDDAPVDEGMEIGNRIIKEVAA